MYAMRTSPNSYLGGGGQCSAFSETKSRSLLEIRQKQTGDIPLCSSVQRTAHTLIRTPLLLPVNRPVLQLQLLFIVPFLSLEVHKFHSYLVISVQRTIYFKSMKVYMLTSKDSECLIILSCVGWYA
jgi:hypothetical protein